MPKETFFNLAKEKRELICDVAVDEFAAYGFEQASINRIVSNAGIAKGSFYQYFEDKKDLFLYILKRIADEKMIFLAPTWDNLGDKDLFSSLRELTIAAIRFARQNPRYSAIGDSLLADRTSEIFKDILKDNGENLNKFFGGLLEQAAARGEIRADIDINMLSQVVASMYLAAVESPTEFPGQEFDESMLHSVNTFLEVLKNGIGMGSRVPIET